MDEHFKFELHSANYHCNSQVNESATVPCERSCLKSRQYWPRSVDHPGFLLGEDSSLGGPGTSADLPSAWQWPPHLPLTWHSLTNVYIERYYWLYYLLNE